MDGPGLTRAKTLSAVDIGVLTPAVMVSPMDGGGCPEEFDSSMGSD